MGELGCNDVLKISMAFSIYLDLCEVRRLWDVEYKYVTKMDMIYLTAKKKKNSETEIFIPWPAWKAIKLRDIEEIQKEVKCQSFTLAVKSTEGVNLFYNINEGLLKPFPPDKSKEVRSFSRRKAQLETSLKYNIPHLYELAMSQGESSTVEANPVNE